MKRLIAGKAILTVFRYALQQKLDQMLKDKSKAYVGLHGLVKLESSFRAAIAARIATLLGRKPTSSESERERAMRIIVTYG